MIRYLKQEEKIKTRAMYEANFSEDTRAFVDYYYTHKTADNRILVMEEAGKLQVMIHLNPYSFRICGQSVPVNYVVAVATDPSVRKQGKMAAVMEKALRDMAAAHQPFTFLIPANYKVYLSSGFAFVPTEKYEEVLRTVEVPERQAALQAAEVSESRMALQAAEVSGDRVTFQDAGNGDIPAMSRLANELLEREYDIFPEHTADYYRRMMAEMECQNGGLVLIRREKKLSEKKSSEKKSRITGIFSYGREDDQAELQELLAEKECREELAQSINGWLLTNPGDAIGVSEMNFMFRILDLPTLVHMLSCKKPFSIKVHVQDNIFTENAGSYEIRIGRERGTILDIPMEETECTMDISELTRYLFGKMRIFIREWV